MISKINIGGTKMAIQDKFNKSNTIYKITKDIDLGGGTLTIPEDCTLDFQGGSFSNGTITGSNTGLKANLERIFGEGIQLSGSWNIIEIYPEWFGATGDGSSDDYQSIQQALTTAKNINIKKVSLSKEYFISSTLNVYNGTILDANGIYETWNPPSIIVNGISAIKLVPDSDTCRVRIRNFNIKNSAMSYINYGIYIEPNSDSELLGISQSLFENLLIEGFKEGIFLHIAGSEGFYTNTFKQVHIGECTVGIHIKGTAVGEQADTWANYNKIESCVISHCQVGGIWLDGLRSTAVFLIDYCDIENNGSCTDDLLAEYDGCFGFKFSSVNGPCIISNCYLENNIARISGELASGDLNHSALFLGTGMNIEVHSCLITSYRRVILCEGQATIKFHDNRWGREYNNQALTDSLIKFKLNNYAMEFTSLVFHETINRTYSIMTGNLYSVDDYDNDHNSNNISCIAVDVNCNKFGVYKSGFDGVRYCTQLFVDEVNGHSKATGFTINDPINSLAEISKLIYNGSLHYGNELRIHINGIAHYNSYNNQYQNFGHNVRIGGYTSRDVDKLIIEDTYGIICTGDITLAGLTIEYGEQCNSLFRLKGDNVSIFIDYSKIKGINSSKNIVYTVPNRSPYGNYSGGSLFLSGVVIDDTFTSQQEFNPISINGNKMSYDAVNLTVPKNLSIVYKHNVTISGKVLDGSDTSVYKGDDYRIYTMGADYKLLTLCSFLSGASEARPTEGLPVGFMFYDTTLGKPIYWDGSKWVDSTGTVV